MESGKQSSPTAKPPSRVQFGLTIAILAISWLTFPDFFLPPPNQNGAADFFRGVLALICFPASLFSNVLCAHGIVNDSRLRRWYIAGFVLSPSTILLKLLVFPHGMLH
jgi:hypothetical protein